MGVRLLENSAWGFDSNCFVCEPTNARGLRIPFAYDDESCLVTAELCLGPEHSGVPRYVHGGVVLAILDEAMAWASIASAGRFAVVHQTATTFDRPVRVGQPYRVEASVEAASDVAVTARARIVSADGAGRLCARAHARLVVMTPEAASAAVGELTDDEARFLRAQSPGDSSPEDSSPDASSPEAQSPKARSPRARSLRGGAP